MQHTWWQKLTRVLGFRVQATQSSTQQTFLVGPRALAVRDVALLRPVGRGRGDPKLIKALLPNGQIQGHKGSVRHADIIGKSPRDIVKATTGVPFRVHEASLSDYVLLTRRLVTPIYPADANVIVSLFDIHVARPLPSSSPVRRYEMLEAGTGHGALTLHLSRAIHAGNTARSTDQSEDEWRAARNAVLHTIDISEKYSKHAEKVVAGFRQGLYAGNVNFNVGSVSEWVRAEVFRRGDESPFLANAFLDLPGLEDHLEAVSSVLVPDARLIVFAPSITQILACFDKARKEKMPLILDQVIELGTNGSSGGRQWDVRAVVPRERIKRRRSEGAETGQSGDAATDVETLPDAESVDVDVEHAPIEAEAAAPDAEEKLVCRPKVGDRVQGGGFLAVFIKKGVEG